VSRLSSVDRMGKGIVYAPRTGRRQGLVMQMSVRQNASLGNEKKYAKGPFINEKKEKDDVDGFVGKMRVKTPSLQTLVGVLSGGNQQKVILARSLAREAKIFLMDEPTVGIDVGAREEIYELISEIVRGDASVLIASSDMNEILEVCDRIAIIAAGRIVAVMDRKEAEEEKMLLYAMGDEKNE
jgi:ribose transport system ATP-binding protein